MTRRHLLGGLTALLLASCGDQVAGGSTDTETGALTGVAILFDGNRPTAALIEVHPDDSLATALGPVAARFTTRADDSGRWHVEGVPSGRWSLVLTSPEGKRALLGGRRVEASRTDSSVAILHTPATLHVVSASGRRAWIEGTSLATDLAAGNGSLASVPAGYAFRVRTEGGVSDSLVLRPTQDTTIVLP